MLASIGVLEDVTDLTGLHPNQNLGRPDPCPARVQESLPTSTRTSQTVQEASGAAGCCLLCSGPDAAYGPGNATSGARELQSGAARVDKPGVGGRRPPRVAARRRGPREVRVGPGRLRRRGRRGRTHPCPRRAPEPSTGRGGPELRRAPRGDTLAPAWTPVRPPRRPPPTPGSPRPDTAHPATPLARAPGPPSSPPPARGEPGEEAPGPRTLRKAWVTWGVAGGWAAFRE